MSVAAADVDSDQGHHWRDEMDETDQKAGIARKRLRPRTPEGYQTLTPTSGHQ